MPAGFQGFGNAAGFVGSGSFTPGDISDLEAWYRADLGVTLVSGKVSQWDDQSGAGDSGRNLVQATAGDRPLFVVSSANFGGRPTLIANDSGDFMASGTWNASLSQPYTAFVVALANGSGASAVVTDGAVEGSSYIYEAGGANVWSFYAGTGLTTAVDSTTASSVICKASGNSSAVYANTLTPVTGPGGSANYGNSSTVMNSRSTHSFADGVEMAEYALWSRLLTDNEISRLMAYASVRYGITIV